MKSIIFSNHAEQRRKQRGLSLRQIQVVIENPEYVKTLEDRRIAVKEVMNRIITKIKGRSSRFLRKEFPQLLRLPSLWTHSYFVSTAGNISSESIKKYIEQQSRI